MKRAYSIVCPCNAEQAEEITPELQKLGYKSNGAQKSIEVLITYISGDFQFLLGGDKRHFHIYGNDENRVVLEEYNKDLILALASQYEDKDYHVGEYIHYGEGKSELPDSCYRISSLDSKNDVILEWLFMWPGKGKGYKENYRNSLIEMRGLHFRKLNAKELIELFNNQTTKKQEKMVQKSRFTVGSKSKAIREAICQELKSRGFRPHSGKTDTDFIANESYCLTQMRDGDSKEYQLEEKGSNPANQTHPKDRHYELPSEWNEAFAAWEEFSKVVAKKKAETFEISYEEGSLYFVIDQGEDIVVYETEEDMDDDNALGTISKAQLEAVIAGNKKILGCWAGYEINVSTISIGCKKNMDIADFEALLEVYNKVNS